MSKKVRIEIRLDEVEDKEMIDFIDKYGSTRAGFIKQVLKVYKNQLEDVSSIPTTKRSVEAETENKNTSNSNRKKISTNNDISFSSKDM